MKTQRSPYIATALALLMAGGLAACNNDSDKTAGEKLDSAVATTEQKASDFKADVKENAAEANADMKEHAAEAKSDMHDATQDAKEAIKDTAADAKEATMDAAGKAKQVMGDAGITTAVNVALAKDKTLSALKIDVDTKDGRVALSGTAPDVAAKERATQLASNVNGVLSVDNRLTVR
ncbi:MAG: BON domain-containing protein [Betaproteobacteria bacterium]